MTSILLTDAEWSGLLEESAETLKVYVFLRRAMDFKTGIARGFTEIDIRDVLRVPAVRGRKKDSTTELADVSRQHARTILQRLQKLGYIEPLRDQGSLVFELPHGVGVIASKTMTNRSPTKQQPDDQPDDQPKKRRQRHVNKEDCVSSATGSPHDDQPYDGPMTNHIGKDGNTVIPKEIPSLRSGSAPDASVTVIAADADASPAAGKRAAYSEAQQAAHRATWEAYSRAYVGRYGVEPVRNGAVNRQIVEFVKRLGAEEAPDVATAYLSHNGAYYVRSTHSFGALLHDAESLRTQWATGRSVTAAAAQQADRTSANASAAEAAKDLLRKRRAANG